MQESIAASDIPQTPTVPHISFKWMHRILGSGVILTALALIGALGLAYWFVQGVVLKQQVQERKMDLVIGNLRIVNEQTIIREIVDERIGDRLDSDTKGRIAFEIFQGSRNFGIPASLIMGLIEQESRWDPKARNASGASSLMQIMPDTAIAYFKRRGLVFSLDRLMDPVTNVSLGIEVLADKQAVAVMQNHSAGDDFTYALYYYCGKGDAYAREVITRSVAYRKRLDTPLEGKAALPEPTKPSNPTPLA